MRDAGGTVSRILGGVKGALGNLQHTAYIGPKSLNGGEVVIDAGRFIQDSCGCKDVADADGCVEGKCEYMYRMQNTVDHTNVADLASIIGVAEVSSEHT